MCCSDQLAAIHSVGSWPFRQLPEMREQVKIQAHVAYWHGIHIRTSHFSFSLHFVGQQALGSRSVHYGFVFFSSTDLPQIGLIRFRLDWIRLEEPGIYYVTPKDTENRQRLRATRQRPQKCLCLFARHTKCHKLMLCGCVCLFTVFCSLVVVLIVFAKIVNIISFSDTLKYERN